MNGEKRKRGSQYRVWYLTSPQGWTDHELSCVWLQELLIQNIPPFRQVLLLLDCLLSPRTFVSDVTCNTQSTWPTKFLFAPIMDFIIHLFSTKDLKNRPNTDKNVIIKAQVRIWCCHSSPPDTLFHQRKYLPETSYCHISTYLLMCLFGFTITIPTPTHITHKIIQPIKLVSKFPYWPYKHVNDCIASLKVNFMHSAEEKPHNTVRATCNFAIHIISSALNVFLMNPLSTRTLNPFRSVSHTDILSVCS